MQKFVVNVVSSSTSASVVEIYRISTKGRSSLTTVTVGSTAAERGETANPYLPKGHRDVALLSGSRLTTLERRASVAAAVKARKALSALSLDVIRAL